MVFDGKKYEVLDGKGVFNNWILEYIMVCLVEIGV